MRGILTTVFLFGAAMANTGCLGRQFARDAKGGHAALADVYTEQAMTNLIFARNHFPFVQLKYGNMSVTDQDDAKATFGLTQTVVTDRQLFSAAATRALENILSLDGNANRKRVYTLNSTPITTQNDIYHRYLAFAHDPALFVVSDTAPTCAVHIQRKHDHKYYWVPRTAGPAFLDLVLYTSQMRAPETATQIRPYEVQIVQVVKPTQVKDEKGNSLFTNATLVFDKAIPNGDATLVVDLDGKRRVQIALFSIRKTAKNEAIEEGQLTDRMDAQWSEQALGVTPLQLMRRPARIYSYDYPQEAPLADPILRQIAIDINQIRINSVLGNPLP